jgi:hypothetical protein
MDKSRRELNKTASQAGTFLAQVVCHQEDLARRAFDQRSRQPFPYYTIQ